MQEKVIQNYALYCVGWVDKPNISDGLRACWVFNPTSPLCHFFMHSTISYRNKSQMPSEIFSDGIWLFSNHQ